MYDCLHLDLPTKGGKNKVIGATHHRSEARTISVAMKQPHQWIAIRRCLPPLQTMRISTTQKAEGAIPQSKFWIPEKGDSCLFTINPRNSSPRRARWPPRGGLAVR